MTTTSAEPEHTVTSSRIGGRFSWDDDKQYRAVCTCGWSTTDVTAALHALKVARHEMRAEAQ